MTMMVVCERGENGSGGGRRWWCWRR